MHSRIEHKLENFLFVVCPMFSWKIHSGDLKEEDQQYMQDVYAHFAFELTSKVVLSAL